MMRSGLGVRPGACAGLGLVLAVVLCALTPTHTRAATWLEKNFWLSGPNYDRDLPQCQSHLALDRIMFDFHTKEARFWNSQLTILGFENIHEIDTMPWAAQSIPRRFCGATALINDSTRHAVYYSIAEDTGTIGFSWGINFCVVGFDRNWAYNPDCRSAKP